MAVASTFYKLSEIERRTLDSCGNRRKASGWSAMERTCSYNVMTILKNNKVCENSQNKKPELVRNSKLEFHMIVRVFL